MGLERVEVVYALPDAQSVVGVDYVRGMTALEAVQRSRLIDRHPELSEAALVLGCFGRRISLEHALRPGDRVEICRPLHADPREKRKQLSREGRVIGAR